MAVDGHYNLSLMSFDGQFFKWNYIKPWSRFFPFFVGVCGSFPYFQFRFDTSHVSLFSSLNQRVLSSKLTRVALYFLGLFIVVFLTCMHGWLNTSF